MGPRITATKYGNHPLVKYVRSMDEELYLGREVAEQLGCSSAMLAYLRHTSPTPMGATHKAQYGATQMHLYTPARIAEIEAYLKQISRKKNGGTRRRRGPVKLWTTTEMYNRARAFDRVRNYRRRALAYREAGAVDKAVRLEKLIAELTEMLGKALAARRRKVHGTKK